ncbi:MAG: hypothetical protein MUD13_02040 [Candidatus Nanopelagicales bacterium]|nr:hypothetical protein [Candidatus Nanopelagicales bacterium]
MSDDRPPGPRAEPQEPPLAFAAELRTPGAAAIAGIVFAAILLAVLVLLHRSVPAGAQSADWVVDEANRRAVSIAASLIPFAGISFLWFIGVIRSRLGDREDKLFATVFLGSGLLFVAMLFVATSFLATILVLASQGVPVRDETMVALQVLTRELMGAFGARMAAVFTLAVTSVGVRTRLLPRWLVAVGLLAAILLLLSPPLTAWVQVAFPLWVLALSVQFLMSSRTRD